MSIISKRFVNSLFRISAAAMFATFCGSATAQEPGLGQTMATTEIYGDSLSQVHGGLGVNQAAGDANAQSNSRAIAMSLDGGVAIAYTFDKQDIDLNQVVMPDVAVSRIADNAFNGTSGLISINQASGVQNVQLNAFAMAMSINGELSDVTLAETHSDAPVNWPDSPVPVTTQREAHVENTAFVGATGIVQLNQASGSGNIASNHFEMSMLPPY